MNLTNFPLATIKMDGMQLGFNLARLLQEMVRITKEIFDIDLDHLNQTDRNLQATLEALWGDALTNIPTLRILVAHYFTTMACKRDLELETAALADCSAQFTLLNEYSMSAIRLAQEIQTFCIDVMSNVQFDSESFRAVHNKLAELEDICRSRGRLLRQKASQIEMTQP